MLKVGVIGIGNAGNQIAALAHSQGFDAIALNSSERDLQNVKNEVPSITIGDERGAGKDRNIAKAFIKEAAPEILSQRLLDSAIVGNDIVIVASSSDGGTGGGMAPALHAVLSSVYKDVHFIILAVVPSLSESLAAQQNTLEYLKEMKRVTPSYLLYDNNKFAHLGPVSMIQNVNNEIIEDFKVIRGDYQLLTPYTSIDEKDAMKIYQTAGRLVIGRSSGFKEKDIDSSSIEERIVEHIKSGAHVELETDRIVKRSGLILNMSQKLYETVDTSLPTAKKAFGEPVEGFEHIAVGDNYNSRAVLLLSGLSFPDDRIEKTMQRIQEVQDKLNEHKTSILDSIDLTSVADIRKDNKDDESEAPVDTMSALDILNGY